MKQLVWFIIFGAILLYSAVQVYLDSQKNPLDMVPVILVDGLDEPSGAPEVAAYESVLEEEGVAFQRMTADEVQKLSPTLAAQTRPALIFPDQASRMMRRNFVQWLLTYLEAGGSVLFVYDSGSQRPDGAYYKTALWEPLAGVEYFNYYEQKGDCVTHGTLRVTDEPEARLLAWPEGKLDAQGHITSYKYGRLNYPTSVARVTGPDVTVLMETVAEDQAVFPALTLRAVKQGEVMWVNLPLGFLKGDSDDLVMRTILRAFLFDRVQVPHLVNTPDAKGGLVINWHIDSNIEWDNLARFMDEGFLRESLPCSMHITAGDFCDAPGDDMGFDACGRGRALTEKLLTYGELGSHGGWGHNWFAARADGEKHEDFSAEDIRKYIDMNNRCVAEVAGYPVREYAAPNGLHPQPLTTQILEEMGIGSYYYPGDAGSGPNRTFLRGKMVSSKLIAFPVMPYRTMASLYELYVELIPDAVVEAWLKGLVDYIVEQRVVRLWYSHPYDVPRYPVAVKGFLDYAEQAQEEGRINVRPMSFFADFLKRFLAVKQTYGWSDNGLVVAQINSDEGLREICLAVPKRRYLAPAASDAEVREEGVYYHVCPKGDVDGLELNLQRR